VTFVSQPLILTVLHDHLVHLVSSDKKNFTFEIKKYVP